MNQNNCQVETEIDLVQFCMRLLVQWRAIVAVALTMGLLVMAGRYLKEDYRYRASVDTSEASKMAMEDVEELLTREEIDAVKLAVLTQQQIDIKDAYLNDSVLMNMNLATCKTVTVQYLIKTDAAVDAADVSYLYQSDIKTDENVKAFGNEIGMDLEVPYIRELFKENSASYVKDGSSQTAILEVTFYAPENMDATTVATALRNMVENCGDVEKKLPHTMAFLSSVINVPSVSASQIIQKNQLTVNNELASLKNTQKTTVDAFSDNQKKLYQMYYTGTEEKSSGASEVADTKLSVPIFICPRYFAVGALVGVVLYVGLFFAHIFFNSRAVELSVADITKMPCLGLLKKNELQKRFLSFFACDNLVYKMLYGEQDEQLSKPENIIGQMRVYAGGEENKRFRILQPGFDLSDSESIQALKEKATTMGVDITVVPVDVCDVSDTVSKLDADIPTVVSIYESKTKKKDIYALYEILNNQKVRTLGDLYVR